MIAAGFHAAPGSAPKTASMAAFDCRSMRFIASWKPASKSVPTTYWGAWRRN